MDIKRKEGACPEKWHNCFVSKSRLKSLVVHIFGRNLSRFLRPNVTRFARSHNTIGKIRFRFQQFRSRASRDHEYIMWLSRLVFQIPPPPEDPLPLLVHVSQLLPAFSYILLLYNS